jgi:hypothetical protein
MFKEAYPNEKCKHCGDAVIFTGHTAQGFDTDYMHANMIRRCLPEKSGQPYGLEADVEREIDRILAITAEISPPDVKLLFDEPDYGTRQPPEGWVEPLDRLSWNESSDDLYGIDPEGGENP